MNEDYSVLSAYGSYSYPYCYQNSSPNYDYLTRAKNDSITNSIMGSQLQQSSVINDINLYNNWYNNHNMIHNFVDQTTSKVHNKNTLQTIPSGYDSSLMSHFMQKPQMNPHDQLFWSIYNSEAEQMLPNNKTNASTYSNNILNNIEMYRLPQPTTSTNSFHCDSGHSSGGTTSKISTKTEIKNAESVKTRKKRKPYSRYQTMLLESEYVGNTYITRQKRWEIACKLHLSERQIKVWFQNRRMKTKKIKNRGGYNEITSSGQEYEDINPSKYEEFESVDSSVKNYEPLMSYENNPEMIMNKLMFK